MDIGTDRARIAAFDWDAHPGPGAPPPELVRNEMAGEASIPAVFFQADGSRLIGDSAGDFPVSRPTDTFHSFWDLLGDRAKAATAATHLGLASPAACPAGSESAAFMVPRPGAGGERCPVAVPSALGALISRFTQQALSHVAVRRGAGAGAPPPVPSRLILVAPTAATAEQRADCIDAAAVAGWGAADVALVDSGTAAAASLLASRRAAAGPSGVVAEERVVVVDVGRAFATAAVVDVGPAAAASGTPAVAAVRASHLGCRAVDRAMAAAVGGGDVAIAGLPARVRARLERAAVKAKEILSAGEHATIEADSAAPGGGDLFVKVGRGDVETAARGLADGVAALCSEVIAAAGAPAPTAIEVVGGGWRVPTVRLALQGIAPVFTRIDAATAATIGALHHCAAVPPASVFGTQAGRAGDAVVAAWREAEAAAQATDGLWATRAAARNELEAAIGRAVESLDTPAARRCVSAAEKAAVRARVDEERAWLDDAPPTTEAAELDDRRSALMTFLTAGCPGLAAAQREIAAEEEEKERQRVAAREAAALVPREARTDGERLLRAKERRDQGAELFKKGDHKEEAVTRFVQALALLNDVMSPTDEQRAEANKLRLSCTLNLASLNVQLQRWVPARDNARRALEIDPASTKAQYRLGQALLALGDAEGARDAAAVALKAEPTDAALLKLQADALGKIAADAAREKATYARMFG